MGNCAWCHKKTNLPAVFAAEAPLMEWMEKRIDAIENNHQIMRSHSALEVSQIRTDLTNMSKSIQDNVFIEVQATSQHENQETQTII